MKFAIKILITTFFFVPLAEAKECFLVKEKETIVKNEGDCKSAFSPHSTFKIALSLMGFDSGLLVNETTPAFPFKSEYSSGIIVCKG